MTRESSIGLIVKNAGIDGIGTVLNAIILLGSSVVITRTIGAELFGKYSLALSIFQIAGIFGIFGLNTGVVKLTSKYVTNRDASSVKGTLINGMALTAILSTVLALIVMALAPVLASRVFRNVSGMEPVLRIYIIGMPFFALMMVINAYSQGLKTLKYSVAVELILRPVIRICLIVILFMVGLRLFAVVTGSVAAYVISVGIALYFVRKISPFDFGKTTPTPLARELFYYSLPLVFARFMLVIVPRSNTIMVGYFTDSLNTGLFGAAASLAPFMSMSLQSFGKIFAPVAAGLWEARDLTQLGNRLKSVAKWTFSTGLPICLAVLLFAPGILLAFGPDFEPAAAMLRLIAVGQIFNILVGPVGYVLVMTGRQKLDLINSIGLAVMSIGLNLVFIPRWGIAGAGFSLMVSMCAVNMARVIEVKILYGITPFRWDFFKPAAAGAITAGAFYFLNRHLMWNDLGHTILLCVVFLIAYAALLHTFGLREEKQVLLEILRRRK